MFNQRFWKLDFVVLALALWASTAFGQGATTLGPTPNPVSITYVMNGGLHNQSEPTATATSSITSSTNSPGDSVTVTSCAWLSVTGTSPILTSATYTFAAIDSGAAGDVTHLAAGDHTCTVHFAVATETDYTMVVTVHVLAQPLTTTTTSVPLSYAIGSSVMPSNATPVVIILPANGVTTTFTVDPTSIPPWLSVTPTGGTTNLGVTSYSVDSSVGNTVAFAGSTQQALSALTTGTVTANVRFNAAGYPATTQALTIPVTLNVYNSTATLSLLEGASGTTVNKTWTKSTTVYPSPTVTPISSNETVPFTATCGVVSSPANGLSNPCTLTLGKTVAATVNGVAYGWGTPLAITLAHGLFDNQMYGTTVTVTVTVNTIPAATALTYAYQYTIQPTDPTLTALSPTSVAQITAANSSLLVTLKGTNFVSQTNIVPGSALSPTQVFLGASGLNVTSQAVVVDANTITLNVTVDEIPTLGSSKSVALPVGIANQTGAVAPSGPALTNATLNLNVTSAPVIYAITSTASYIQPSQAVASPSVNLVNPNVAPYELVSIFGANFGLTSNVGGTLDPTYFKYGTTVNAGTVASPVNVSVTFKGTGAGSTTLAAPILFANASQINVLVPSGLVAGTLAAVTVTDGTTSSDGLFQVNVVAADPGIFTINSDGQGQGAVLIPGYIVNSGTNPIPATTATALAIYVTGLGVPDSVGDDSVNNKVTTVPGACVKISNTTAGHPGYMEVVNKANTTTGYVPPTPAWKNIDGAVFQTAMMALPALYPPCFSPTADSATVDFIDPTTPANSHLAVPASYMGFAPGSVAGLYQVNVTTPSLAADTYNVVVHLTISNTVYNSQAGVTVVVQ